MRGPGLLLISLACSFGCARYVVHVDVEPGEAKVTLNGVTGRGDRWSVAPESAAEIVAVWPDGQRLATAMLIDRDMRVTLRRDGDPSLVIGARPLVAAPPGGPPGVPPGAGPVPPVAPPVALPIAGVTEGDAMVKARALADAGQKAFELTEYDEAIARFKEAYELIRSSKDPKAPEILGNILYNLAVVYEKSYEVTPEPERLRRARVMYRQFDEQMATLVKGWAGTAEHADVLARVRALDARLGGK
jgi:tetratricopeptide (TPR) repeat protein